MSRSLASPAIRKAGGQVVWAFLTLLVLSIVVFFAVNAGRSATDLATQALGPHSAPQARASYIQKYRLDDPVVVRYGRWLGDFVQGDWGVSYTTQREVRADVLPRLERSLILAFASLLIGVPIALVLGLYTARWWGTRREMATSFMVIIVNALPEFVVGIILLVIFAVGLGVLPPVSSGLEFGGLSADVKAYVLPIATLVAVTVPYMARVARSAVREALAAPYTRAAVLSGLSRRRVLWDYAMRNAAAPITNAIAINLVYLIGGVIVVENVFSFPGIGQALLQAIGHGDAITVQAIALVFGGIFIATSLFADILVIHFNPRLKARAAS